MGAEREVKRLSQREQFVVTDHIRKNWEQYVQAKLTAQQIAERCSQDLKIDVTKGHVLGIVNNALELNFDHVEQGGHTVRYKLKKLEEIIGRLANLEQTVKDVSRELELERTRRQDLESRLTRLELELGVRKLDGSVRDLVGNSTRRG